MPFTPGGNFTLDPQYRAESGQTIRVEQHNPPLEDIASGLSQVMVRDGRAPMVGPLNMNGFSIIGLPASSQASSPATVSQTAPIGSLLDYAGDTAPAGWLLCYGQEVSRSTYAALFAVIGTKFGAGNSSTTFNVPDCRGRVSAGRDDMGGTAAGRVTEFTATSVGAFGGAQSITLTVAQLPAWNLSGTAANAGGHQHNGSTYFSGIHNHSGWTDVQGLHSHTGTTSVAGAHQHGYTSPGNEVTGPVVGPSQRFGAVSSTTDWAGDHAHTLNIANNGNHSHTVGTNDSGNHQHAFVTDTGGVHSHTVTVASGGSGASHSNMQPTIIFNKIIRATYGV